MYLIARREQRLSRMSKKNNTFRVTDNLFLFHEDGLTLKRLGYFGGWKDWGGGGGHDGPPWDLGRGLHDRRENLHNGSVWCNLQKCIVRFSKLVFFILY